MEPNGTVELKWSSNGALWSSNEAQWSSNGAQMELKWSPSGAQWSSNGARWDLILIEILTRSWIQDGISF